MTRRFASLESELLRIAHRLTERDRRIVHSVHRLRVLTCEHLTDLFFDSSEVARHRLLALYRLRLLERFRPRPRAPYHYVVGELGALLVAAESPSEADRPVWRRDHVVAIARSQRLAHLTGVNDIGVSLLARARHHPSVSVRWWPEGRCAPWCGALVRPDARCVYAEDGSRLAFFLEYDRGTEPLSRLAGQVERYARLERDRGVSDWVLYVVPTARRERHVARALARTDVPVATAALPAGTPPHGPVWQPLARPEVRLSLASLAHEPKPEGALAREESGGRHPWRYRGGGDAPTRP